MTSHGPAMSVLTKYSRFLQQYLARVPQNKGTKKEPVGTFHVVRLRRILLRLYLGLPLGAGILSVEETTGELSIYQTKTEFDRPILLWSSFMDDTPQPCRSFRWCHVRNSCLNGLTWLLSCDSVTQDFLRFRQFMVPKRGSRLALNCQRSWGVVLFSAHYWHCVSPDGAACTAFWPQLCFFSQGP